MECDFHITERQYGPTVHMAPAGELGWDAGPLRDGVESRIADSVDVVGCDMALVRFTERSSAFPGVPAEVATAALRGTLTERAGAIRNRAADDGQRTLRPRAAQRSV